MQGRNVLRINAAEEESLYLDAVNRVIAAILAAEPGRTLIDIAEAIDVDKKTISNAFNKTHRLTQIFLTRLGQAFGPECLNPVAALAGARMVRLEADERMDPLTSTSAAVHSLAVVKSDSSPGGSFITHTELLSIEPKLDDAINALLALKERCTSLRSAA